MKRGMTLLELMIVIAIMVCMATLSLSFLPHTDRFLVRNEVDTLYFVLRATQQKARMLGRPLEVLFDTQTNRYAVEGVWTRLADGVFFGVPPGAQGPPAQPTGPITAVVTFPRSRVICHPDGVLQAGAVYVTDRSHTCAYAISCPVAQVSSIRRYVYSGSWVVL